MEVTKNYALNKPEQDDFYDVDDFNKNADIIDEELYALENLVYEDAKTLETLKSGEKIVTAFGKIAKAITDFISHISDEVVHITADERMKWNAKQDASTAITTGNIGNQSVKHAKSADTIGTDTVGSTDAPVYVNAGKVTSTGKKFSDYLKLTGGTVKGYVKVQSTNVSVANPPEEATWANNKIELSDNNATTIFNVGYRVNPDGTTQVKLNSPYGFVYTDDLRVGGSPVVTDANIGSKTAGNAKKWNGRTEDFDTANTSDTWLLVSNGDKVQHREVSSLPFLPSSGGSLTGNLSVSGTLTMMNKDIYLNNHSIFSASILQGNNVLRFRTPNNVAVENVSGSENMDLYCAYLHCVSVTNTSYREAKENIAEVSEETARKILDVPIFKFDYRPGFGDGKKNVVGTIVDEVQSIIPESVVIPEDWNEDEFNELLGDIGNGSIPSVDYTTFIPYLIAMVQLQQKEIDELKQKVTALENKN